MAIEKHDEEKKIQGMRYKRRAVNEPKAFAKIPNNWRRKSLFVYRLSMSWYNLSHFTKTSSKSAFERFIVVHTLFSHKNKLPNHTTKIPMIKIFFYKYKFQFFFSFNKIHLWLLLLCSFCILVSLFGASYIHFPVQEAKGSTDISFRFRTHLADAILILAAGKTDYCLIKLEAGRLKVRFFFSHFT